MTWDQQWRQLSGYGTKTQRQIAYIVSAVIFALFVIISLTRSTNTFSKTALGSQHPPSTGFSSNPNPAWVFDARRDANNYGLTSEQCDSAFPGLFTEIERVVESRRHKPITKKELSSRDSWPPGTVRVLIWDQQIYVIDAVEPTLRKSRIYTTLHSLNRALMAASDRQPLRNIEFVFSIEDWTVDRELPIWSYDRKPDDMNTWLMPDFGFYAWPEPGIGTFSEVRRRMRDVEDQVSFDDKIQKLVWRGAIEPAVAPVLRQNLVEKTTNKTWADVKVLVWEAETDEQRHRLDIEDHCKYAFIQHTEGRAWSGRLKYVQNCESVIVAHKLFWIQHHQHLLVSSGPLQNFVQVENDFSDLEDKMEYLVEHPEEARRIAKNSVENFRDRYITPAAIACYWRKMVEAWGQVSFEPEFYKEGPDGQRKWRGVPFESFAIMRKLEWQPF